MVWSIPSKNNIVDGDVAPAGVFVFVFVRVFVFVKCCKTKPEDNVINGNVTLAGDVDCGRDHDHPRVVIL